MDREEALEKIAWHHLKKLTREEATELIIEFFEKPLKPSLREKLNITAVIQWETHQPPLNLQPGNPIYRPILLDKMKRVFRGVTNEFLVRYLKEVIGLEVNQVEGKLPGWLPCPVCNYLTFEVLGDWDTCPVCGWNSDPVQETIHEDPTGANGISLNEARRNYQEIGAVTPEKLVKIDPQNKQKYPKSA